MPGKVKRADACDGDIAAKKPKAPPKKRGGRKMPPPLPSGVILTDLAKGRWVLGSSVGKGGFGEIYLAAPDGSSVSLAAAKHVVKIEPHENGPLFTELSFYHRVAKPQGIDDWVKKEGLTYLGVPKYIASGSHTHDSMQYRFMVMERYGNDLQKSFVERGRKFSVKTICYLALRLLEALEYLHENEYVHADVKASNILMGHGNKHEVCLVDYGLAYRYSPDGVHKAYKEDPRRKHDGTIEFTSIDAHKGANPSRRGDLEILGYCLLQWACSRLPWEDFLDDKEQVAQQKMKYKGDVDGLMAACFGPAPSTPSCLKEYFQYVYGLSYEGRPDYEMLKGLFRRALKTSGLSDDYTGLDWIAVAQGKKHKSPEVVTSPFSKTKGREEVDNDDEVIQKKPPKAKAVSKQAATRKRSSSKSSKEEASPAKKVKLDEKEGGAVECTNPAKATGTRKRPATKKASPPTSKCPPICDNTPEPSDDEEEEVVLGAKRSLKKPTEEKSSVRACAGSRKPRAVSSKQPDTSGKIPEVTYPASLGYVNSNDAEVEHSSVESGKSGEVLPRKSRRLNPTT